MGSLVFAETIKDLSFHLREKGREGERTKKKSNLSLSCFPEVILRISITHLASRQQENTEGMETRQLKMLKLLLLLTFTQVRDELYVIILCFSPNVLSKRHCKEHF